MESNKPHIIDIGKISDPRGNMSVMSHLGCVPFDIARTSWIHGLPCGVSLKNIAYHRNEQVIVAISGAIDVTLTNRNSADCYTLSQADKGLYIPAMTWTEITTASTNAVVLIVSSMLFDTSDEIHDRVHFHNIIHSRQ